MLIPKSKVAWGRLGMKKISDPETCVHQIVVCKIVHTWARQKRLSNIYTWRKYSILKLVFHLHIAVHLTHSSIVVRNYHWKTFLSSFGSFISSLKNSFRWEPIFILKRLKSIVWTIVWKLYKWFVAVSLQHWINWAQKLHQYWGYNWFNFVDEDALGQTNLGHLTPPHPSFLTINIDTLTI